MKGGFKWGDECPSLCRPAVLDLPWFADGTLLCSTAPSAWWYLPTRSSKDALLGGEVMDKRRQMPVISGTRACSLKASTALHIQPGPSTSSLFHGTAVTQDLVHCSCSGWVSSSKHGFCPVLSIQLQAQPQASDLFYFLFSIPVLKEKAMAGEATGWSSWHRNEGTLGAALQGN